MNTHRAVVEEFTQRVVSTLGDQVESVILYGSVARGDAGPESDIDILVICPDTKYCWDVVSDVADDIVYQNRYTLLVSEVCYSRADFVELRRIGAPFIKNVLDEGVPLHDNGTFSRSRDEVLAVV